MSGLREGDKRVVSAPRGRLLFCCNRGMQPVLDFAWKGIYIAMGIGSCGGVGYLPGELGSRGGGFMALEMSIRVFARMLHLPDICHGIGREFLV